MLRDQAKGERRRDEHGTDGGGDSVRAELGFGNLADGAVEVVRVDEVDGIDGGDGAAGDRFDIDAGAERDAGEDDQLGAGVVAVDVFAGIGFGVAELLRVVENVGEGCAGFHAAENVVAGAVENGFDAGDAIAGKSLLQAGNDGNASGDGCSIEKVRAFGAGEAIELDAVFGDELFVAGDGGFAGFESAAHPGACGFEAAHQLDDDVDVGVEDFVEVLGPDHGGGDPGGLFAGHAAVEDMRELEAVGLQVAENARDGAADGAESQEGDFHEYRVQGAGYRGQGEASELRGEGE